MKKPTKYITITWKLIYLIAAVNLSACGGGGSSTSPATATNTVSTTTTGIITGFGSVYVNGCRYHTGSSTFTVDDNTSANEGNLRVGDMVTVSSSSTCAVSASGTITGTGTATNITYINSLEGVVDSNSVATNNTMIVMGQTITVNALTVFQDKTGTAATVNDITAGRFVEISGYSVGTGTIVATRIEVKYLNLADAKTVKPTYPIEVKGIVTDLNSGSSTFKIGGLTVNYGSATIDDSISGGLSNGLYVEAKSNVYVTGSYNLAATKVELENSTSRGHLGSPSHEVELRGLLTAWNPTTHEVTIGAYTFLIDHDEDDGTRFRDDVRDIKMSVSEGEAALASATIGQTILKGQGKYNSAGKLVADQIRWKDSLIDHDECKGSVSGLVSTGLNAGTLTVLDGGVKCEKGSDKTVSSLAVIIDNSTIMHDSSSVSKSNFNLSHLSDGQYVEVHVDPATGIAIKLERKNAP